MEAQRSAGFALLLTVAVGAARLSAPSPSASLAGIRADAGISRQETRKLASAPSAVPHSKRGLPVNSEAARFVGGCTAFDPPGDASSSAARPSARDFNNENRGAARAFLDKFLALDPAQDSGPQLTGRPGLQVALAFAPDPRHTHLSLMFDRELVAIQQAAQDESLTYDSSWMPWSTDSQSYPLLADAQAAGDLAAQREACPGLMLFRKSVPDPGDPISGAYTSALIVLVVGEQPTGGINQDQWDNALVWMKRNGLPQGARPTLRILGPNFSGSLDTIERELHESSFSERFSRAEILSGSTASCSTIAWFRQQWDKPPAPPPASPNPSPRPPATPSQPTVLFGSFQENDDLQIFRFLSYLKSQGTDPEDTAILSEDETAYAFSLSGLNKNLYRSRHRPKGAAAAIPPPSSSADACDFPYAQGHRAVHLFYPRDISALRTAYEKQSIFSSSSAGARGARAILEESYDSEGSAGDITDSVPIYSGQTSALAQEAVLYGVVDYLRAHHTRYLILRSTNPLDYLFLTRFFHRAYPHARIVTVGQDVLFRREIDTTEFRGVLAISSYPLLSSNQHWSMLTSQGDGIPVHAHRVFESHAMEGTYLAARYLFGYSRPFDQNGSSETQTVSMNRMETTPDYSDPFWMHSPDQPGPSHPPTWLSVVGRDGYWPIAILNDSSTPTPLAVEEGKPARQPPSTMVQLLTGSSAHYDLEPGGGEAHLRFSKQLLFSLPRPWQVAACLVLLLLLYQIAGVWPRKEASSTGVFSVFREASTPSQDLLIGLNSALAMMILVTLASIALALPEQSSLNLEGRAWEIGVCLVLPAAAFLLLAGAIWRRYRAWALLSFVLPLFCLAAIARSMLLGSLTGHSANALPLFYRMGHLTSGVSPLLPSLLLCTGFYLWSWQAVAGNLMLSRGCPILPRLRHEPQPSGPGWWNRFWDRFLDLRTHGQSFPYNRLKETRFRISHVMERRIRWVASPCSLPPAVIGPPLCLFIAICGLLRNDTPLLGLESLHFASGIDLLLLGAFLLTTLEAGRLFWTWSELRRLLAALNRLRLRRTFAHIRAVPANSLWSMSGTVQRVQYSFFSQQLDAVNRLAARPDVDLWSVHAAAQTGRAFADSNTKRLMSGPRWHVPVRRPGDKTLVFIREVFADAVAEVIERILAPRWLEETSSLSLDPPSESGSGDSSEKPGGAFNMKPSDDETVRIAEEFVCFQYIAFIQNILARMRTITLSMVCLFVAVCFAISFYPFVPRTQISLWMMLNLFVIGCTVIYVYAGMERDETLSYISNSKPGKLSGEFWIKTLGFLAGPVIGLVTTQFPAIADSVIGWLQPGLDAMK